jgi:hypothetical protein
MFDLTTLARLNAEAEKKHFEAKDKTIQDFLKNNIVIVAPANEPGDDDVLVN